MKIHELKYSSTNTYLIEGEKGILLFDAGWAGTFPAFCTAMGGIGIPVQKIDFTLISHYHPDHMGIAGEIARQGAKIAVPDVQENYVHRADEIFAKDKKCFFVPIRDEDLRPVPMEKSREFLKELGIDGEILYTPGHSEDSVSLFLDDGSLFVGDLNPLYELELHREDQIGKSWKMLLAKKPKTVYYGHAKTTVLEEPKDSGVAGENSSEGEKRRKDDKNQKDASCEKDLYRLTSRIMKYIDRGMSIERIAKKTGADLDFAENVARMYLTHQDVGVQGILDRIERRSNS